MDFRAVLERRHSVRDFADRPVPHDVLITVLDAASMAPSAHNERPWRFFVAEGGLRARVGQVMAQTTVHLGEYMDALGPERLEEAARWYTELGGAPVVVCLTAPRSGDDVTLVNRMLSLGAALENVLLAATAEGLGSCVITFAYWVHDELAEVFAIPDDREVVALIALGYPGPAAEPPARSSDVTASRE
jgi:nitroreductase